MAELKLFPKDKIVGVFRGFSEGGLEFHADLVLPYRSDFQNIPMHGQFLLVQLETQDEAVLGRITSLSSAGKLSSGVGEEFNIRAVQEERPVPEDLREKYLKYQIDIRVLGILRANGNGNLDFIASHRRLPHVGSPVAFLSDPVLREIAGHNLEGSPIGHFALGEYVYCADSNDAELLDGMQNCSPEVQIKFPIENLISRRSFIFARAGFGKSNLNKFLFSTLYENTPTTIKRGGKKVPVGTILFDPDGEYFWPDDKGRPGLCDVPHLKEKLIIFTNRHGPSPFYHSFIAGGIKIDIRRLRPADVISIAVNKEKQDQQNIAKLRGLNQDSWKKLVDLIDERGNQTSTDKISALLHLDPNQEFEALAARSNMTKIVRTLHDKQSSLIDKLMESLKKGKLCVLDISQLKGNQALILSGIILRRIFDHNQDEFTKAQPNTIPTLAVIEEAQSVLNDKSASAEPYIEWVKEGRKYDLGSVMITQQPGSIPNEILSQGDNWFVFHLLSASDLQNIKNANSHFSSDVLSGLLNEPIPGQGIFWSSSGGKPYPLGLRVLSFEKKYAVLDPEYEREPIGTFSDTLKKDYPSEIDPETGEIDQLALIRKNAVEKIIGNSKLMNEIRGEGKAWGGIKAAIREVIPNGIQDADDISYSMVKPILDEIFGPQDESWESFRHPTTNKTWVRTR